MPSKILWKESQVRKHRPRTGFPVLFIVCKLELKPNIKLCFENKKVTRTEVLIQVNKNQIGTECDFQSQN